MRCPSAQCGVENTPEQKFCDECGTDLHGDANAVVATPSPVPEPEGVQLCGACGAAPSAVDEDGFCACGVLRVHPARNRVEVVVSSTLAGVSDVGCNPLHPDNQDFLAARSSQSGSVLVGADGVSCSQSPADASALAAPAACDALIDGASNPQVDTVVLMKQAISAANDAVMTVPYSPQVQLDPPETTIVAALAQGRKITLGWVGDSRAYFVTETGSVYQLSVDHSLLTALLEKGIPLQEALLQRDAHTITRSLGGPVGGGVGQEPTVKVFNAPGPGVLLLCTDGLWNYAPTERNIAAIFAGLPKNATAIQIARALVEWARQRGGGDNITVLVLIVA